MPVITRAGAFRISCKKLSCYVLLGLLASSCCSDESFARPAETEPILVDAGPDQTVVVGATVSLTGSNNGNTASHKWAFFSKPADSVSEIQDELSLTGASFAADVVGQYEIELIGATSSNPDAPDINPAARDTVVITAESGIRFAPSTTTRVGIEDGRLKLIEADGLVDIGPLFPNGAGDGDEIGQLAYDWTTHVLYGANVGRGSDFPSRRLFTIDLCTGEATEVGELRRPDGETFFLLEGIAVDSAGQIYVTGNVSDVLRSTTLLTVSIDGSVATEAVGDMGTTIDGIDGGADADRLFAGGDRLVISDSFPRNNDMLPPFDSWLYEVDPSDPAMTVDLNSQGISAELNSLAWDPLSDWVEAIDWSSGGWYKINTEGGFAYPLSGLPPIDGPFAFVDRGCGDQPCFDPVILTETFELGDSFDATALPTNGASDTAMLQQAGGNPGGYRHMEHLLLGVPGGSAITVFHLFDQEYDPADGAITHFNYSEDRIQYDPPFPSAVIGGGLFVVQNGIRYTFPLTSGGGTFASLSWERARIDDLGETSFAAGLDFSENGAPIQFGFYRSNSHGESSEAITTTHGIDNWRVEICRSRVPSQCVPTPVRTYEDGDFEDASWTSTIVAGPSIGDFSLDDVTTLQAGGNPGAYRQVDATVTSTAQQEAVIWVAHALEGAVFDPGVDGEICWLELSLDGTDQFDPLVSRESIFAVFLLQDGTYYWGERLFVSSDQWETGTWTTDDFVKFDGDGPELPDFGPSGAPIQFGFLTGSSRPAAVPGIGMTVAGADNFKVQVFQAPVP